MTLSKNLHWLIYILFTLSCAKQTSPTGGPKDSIPPILIGAIPIHKQVNVKTRTIELTFSEAVTVNSPQEQLIIAPTVGKDFEIVPRRNKIILTFEKDFKDSTTYTLNFREAIQDITEKNTVRNLKLAFSTGSYIDSLSVAGNIFQVSENKPLENVTVAMQEYNDTLSILKHKAVYITLSDKRGNFLIENLKPGVYTLYALLDQNKNLIVDSRNESYGFLKDTIQLNTNIHNVKIGIVKQDARPLKLTSARPFNTYFNIRSSKNLRDAKLIAIDKTNLYYTYGADHSNIQLYNTIGDRDSLQIKVSLSDSINNKVDTLLYAKFNKREITPEKFDFQIQSATIQADKGLFRADMKFSKPLKELNFDSLYFVIDSAKTITFQQKDLKFDSLHRILTIEKKVDHKLFDKPEVRNSVKPLATQKTDSLKKTQTPLKKSAPVARKEKPGNQLYLGKGAFISIEQDSSKKITQSISPQRLEDLGMILVEIQPTRDQNIDEPANTPAVTSKKGSKEIKVTKSRNYVETQRGQSKSLHYIVQLLDKQFKVLQSFRNKSKVSFEDLPPSTYLLRLIVDKNNNGIWDAGNYFLKEEPEPIIYYENEKANREINLKANYEIGPLLIRY